MRWLVMLLGLLTMLPGLQAAISESLTLNKLAAAPILVVGRVNAVRVGSPILGPRPRTSVKIDPAIADVEIFRIFKKKSGTPLTADRLRLFHWVLGVNHGGIADVVPPQLAVGQTYVIPLQENLRTDADPWQFVSDPYTIPVTAALGFAPDAEPATARAFLMREISNTISKGSPREIHAIASFLNSLFDDVPIELKDTLPAMIGNDRHHWVEVAAALMAAQGGRHGVAALMESNVNRQPGRFYVPFIAQIALEQLKASPETDQLLIQAWIENAPIYAWGSAVSLLEYKNNPATIERLHQALRRDVAGSSYIAWTLIKNGQRSFLPDAINRALRVADRPNTDYTDIQGAGALLREFGSDQDLRKFAALVKEYQTANRRFYHLLWQYSTDGTSSREARILGVVLRDTEAVEGTSIRQCDMALGRLERAVGLYFGSKKDSVAARDAAISKAIAWLKSNGLD